MKKYALISSGMLHQSNLISITNITFLIILFLL